MHSYFLYPDTEFHFIYLCLTLSSAIRNSSEQKYPLYSPYITHKSQAPQPPTCPSLSSLSTCHPSSPLFRWQNDPSSYSFTLRSNFNTCLNCVKGYSPYITHKSQAPQPPTCPSLSSLSTCHPSSPLFRWQNDPSSYSFTLRSNFNTCLNCVKGLH